MTNFISLFQIPIFLLLIVAAYSDYKKREVSNKLVIFISILSVPAISAQRNFIPPVLIIFFFLVIFYLPDIVQKLFNKNIPDQIGGADVKILIPLLLSMNEISIFIFFVLFSITNAILIFKYKFTIPLVISILFGYFAILLLSWYPFIVEWSLFILDRYFSIQF